MQAHPQKLTSSFDFLSTVFSNLVALFGGVCLVAWIVQLPVAQALSQMTPGTALCLLLLGMALRAGITHAWQGLRLEAIFCTVAALLMATLALVFHLFVSSPYLTAIAANAGINLAQMRVPPVMPPTVAVAFVLIGTSIILLQRREKQLLRAGEVVLIVALVYSLFACLAAFFTTIPFVATYVPMPMATAIPLLLLCLSMVFAHSDIVLGGVLADEHMAGQSARRLTVAAIGATIFIAWLLSMGLHFGLYDIRLALAGQAVSALVIFAGAVFFLAKRLNVFDLKHQAMASQLQSVEHEQHQTFQDVHEAVICLDESGRIVDWNKRVESLLGWAKEETVGKLLTEIIIPQEQRQRYQTAFEDAGSEQAAELFNKLLDIEVVNRDGVQFPVELSISPIDVDGPSRFYLVLRDISQRKLLAEDLERARDQAMESARLKSEFVANMSHEIRTPLNAIIGISDLVLHKELSEDVRDFAYTIHDSADSLLSIVNDILDYSKIEAGKLSIEETDVDILSVVEGVAEMVADKARGKGLSLSSFVSQDVPRVLRGDPGRIRQVMLNFLTNAVKFTHSGEVIARATVLESDDRKAVIEFSVSDTGIGITDDVVTDIFEPFTQADGSVTRRYGGTGLGLSISKRLVELMGGKIGVESKLHQGSTFWFSVTLEKPIRRPHIAPARKVFEDVKLLVVDGATHASEILQAYAQSWGIQCAKTDTGEEALHIMRKEAAANSPFDVALIDFQLTHSDALALAQSVRKYADLASTKLILISSFDDSNLTQDALRAGFSAVLTKPVRQSRLYDCVVNLLMQRPRETEERPAPTPEKKEAEFDESKLILVVEDNPVNQKVAFLQLTELGYAAHAVGNGREALEALSRMPYALVLMDCQMPELDGFQATKIIREREALTGKHVPIVAMTAHAMAEDRYKCLNAGMDNYISKPVKPSKLKDILALYLSEKAQTPVSQAVTTSPNDEPVNIRDLRSRVGGKAVREILETFLSSTASLMEQLDFAVSAHDSDKVHAAAHELAGSCDSISASELAQISRDLETASARADWSKIEQNYPVLKSAFDRVSTYLQFS